MTFWLGSPCPTSPLSREPTLEDFVSKKTEEWIYFITGVWNIIGSPCLVDREGGG